MERSNITRFNKEALSIDEVDYKIFVAAFINGLRKEDALLARKEKPKRGKDRRIPSRIGGKRWLGLENDKKTDVPSPPLGNSQVSPP